MGDRPDNVTALERLERRLAGGGPVPVVGVAAGARGFVGAHLARSGGRTLLAVAADEDAADRFATDLAFFFPQHAEGPDRAIVRVPVDGVLPYDGLSPDRSTELDRLAGLSLLQGGGPRIVVVSARALARRQLPKEAVESSTESIAAGSTSDRDEMARRLIDLGYQSVPMVEDPGTFAVRGGILDVWSPAYEQPARIELFGDEVESVRLFDPSSQRTVESLGELQIVRAREILFDEASRRRGIAAARAAADRVNRPTAKVRELTEAIQESIPAFGVEALLPGFFEEGLVPLASHLPADAVALLDDPVAIDRALEELEAELQKEHAAALERGELALPPEAHFLSAGGVRESLRPFARVELHSLWMGVPGGEEPLRFDLQPTAGLRKEIEGHQGEEGALSPLVDRLKRWRERGWTTLIAAGSAGQADKLRRLLSERKIHVKVREAPVPDDPSTLWDRSVHAWIVPTELTAGFLSPEDRFAVIADEEITGPRVRKKARAPKRTDQPFIAAFRELEEGDLCVHVDHGLCRYGGLQKLNVRGVEGDFLVLHFAGKDKLFLPVSKLRQVQKFVGAGAEHARLDRLGGVSWEKTKKRVKDELLKMAAELLDIYARRKAHPGIRFPDPDRFFEQFEATFPHEETPDQAKAIRDVIADMNSPQPMDRLVCGDVG
ncbi:MAG TPA: CarD family transcriptional regulator, partial [Vulgatibacter sp.]